MIGQAVEVQTTYATDLAVPVQTWLRHWLQDNSLTDFDMRSIIDWEYYKAWVSMSRARSGLSS